MNLSRKRKAWTNQYYVWAILSLCYQPPHYHLTTFSLPPHYLLTTSSLSPYYHLTATSLPPHCHFTTTSLSLHYYLTTTPPPLHYHSLPNSLPPHYHLTTTSLHAHATPLPLHYHLTTTSLPIPIKLTATSLPPRYHHSNTSLPPHHHTTTSLPPHYQTYCLLTTTTPWRNQPISCLLWSPHFRSVRHRNSNGVSTKTRALFSLFKSITLASLVLFLPSVSAVPGNCKASLDPIAFLIFHSIFSPKTEICCHSIKRNINMELLASNSELDSLRNPVTMPLRCRYR